LARLIRIARVDNHLHNILLTITLSRLHERLGNLRDIVVVERYPHPRRLRGNFQKTRPIGELFDLGGHDG
jgi:hypothetical protein